MSNSLIAKSVIRDNIHIFIPYNIVDNDLLILISHGSGGIGSAEWNTAEFFLKNGYKVGLLNYFSKWNISVLWWNFEENYRDNYDVSFNKMLTDIKFPNEKIIHIGFSLGGFLGLLNTEKFILNFSFYPGIIGYTKDIVSKDYNNSTVFIAELDNWCDNYTFFEQLCLIPANKIIVRKSHHGFMIPNKNKNFVGAKYNLPCNIITDEEFNALRPNHLYMSSKYNFNKQEIRLKYNKKECIIQLNKILERIHIL